jgi:anti-anti-sigma factor
MFNVHDQGVSMKTELIIGISGEHPLGIISLSGFLGTTEVYKLKAAFDTLFRDLRKGIILNLMELNYIDSAGIGILIQLRNACNAHDVNLVVVHPLNNQIQKALEISAVGKLLRTFNAMDKAKEYMASVLEPSEKIPTTPSPENPEELALIIKNLVIRIGKIEQRLAALEDLQPRS